MFYNSSNDYNDCVSHGACSQAPNVSSIQEILLTIIKQTTFYLTNLLKFEIKRDDIVRDIIYILAFSDSVKDLSDDQIIDLFTKQYANLLSSKKKYEKISNDNNVKPQKLKALIKLPQKLNLPELLKLGEKEFLNKYKSVNDNKKYFAEILVYILKSLSVNLVNLSEYSVIPEIYSRKILTSLNLFNSARISAETLKKHIDELAELDLKLLSEISKMRNLKFGQISLYDVSLSTVPGKVIMVSGTNLNDLDKLLNAVKSTDIDIYTNGNLLIAHAFEYFRKFKNLKGHFGNAVSTTMLDFATFPGAILLTKNETQNIEYLYRGRLFTTDKITPKGVSRLADNNFEPLIASSLQAKGFAKGQKRPQKNIGYNSDTLKIEIRKLLDKKPAKIHIIGYSDLSRDNLNYLNNFFEKLPENEAVISFSINSEKKNVLFLDLCNDYAALHDVLKIIFEDIPVNSENLYFHFTRCDVNSLSNIINLKNRGAKNIYLSNCQPFVINPAILKTFRNIYGINEN